MTGEPGQPGPFDAFRGGNVRGRRRQRSMLVLLWAVIGIVDPTLAARVDWPWFVVSQIAFGVAAGIVVARAHPLATMQTWPLAARAGVEASGAPFDQERDR